MSTISLIVVIILGLSTGFLIIIMFTPVIITAAFTVSEKERNLALLVHLIHPSIVRWKYSVDSGISELNVLGWTRNFLDSTTAGKKEVVYADDGKASEALPSVPITHTAPRRNDECSNETSRVEEPSANRKKDGQKWSTWQTIKLFFKVIGDGRNRRAVVKALRWCGRTLRLCLTVVGLHRVRLHVRAGAGDPAEIGKLYGYFTALDGACFSVHRNADVRFTPEFIENVIECDGAISLNTSCARIALPLLAALVTFPYLTAYFVWRRHKKLTPQKI